MRKRLLVVVVATCGLVVGPAYSQSQPTSPTQQRALDDRDQVPVYRVRVVARTTPAINYRHRGGATTIDFRGTPLLPKARGEAKVESKQGYIEIEVEFDDLVPARKFGPEYLTYVMWAITPEGRATNLGEVLLNESRKQAERHDRAPGLRTRRDRGAVLRRLAAERRGRDGERDPPRHARQGRLHRCQVRAADARLLSDEHGPGPDRRPSHGPQDAAGAVRSAQCGPALGAGWRRSLRG